MSENAQSDPWAAMEQAENAAREAAELAETAARRAQHLRAQAGQIRAEVEYVPSRDEVASANIQDRQRAEMRRAFRMKAQQLARVRVDSQGNVIARRPAGGDAAGGQR